MMHVVVAQLAGWFALPSLAVAGVLCVALPVAVHLWSRRRRRQSPWGAMRFLALAYKKQRRRLQLERWLLLAARCLVVVVAGLALAGPLVGGAGGGWATWWDRIPGLGHASANGSAADAARVVHVVVDDALGGWGTLSAADGPANRAGEDDANGAGGRWARRQGLAQQVVRAARDGGDRVVVWRTSAAGEPESATTPQNNGASQSEDGPQRGGEAALAGGPGYGRSNLSATLAAVRRTVEADSSNTPRGSASGSEVGGGGGAGGGGEGGAVVVAIGGWERGVTDLGEPVPAELAGLGGLAKLVVSPAEAGRGNVEIESLDVRRGLVVLGGESGLADGGRGPAAESVSLPGGVTGGGSAGAVGVEVVARRWGDLEQPATGRLVITLHQPGQLATTADPSANLDRPADSPLSSQTAVTGGGFRAGVIQGGDEGGRGGVERAVSFGVGQARAVVGVEVPLGSGGQPGNDPGGWVVQARLEMSAGVADAVSADNVRWASVSVRDRLEVGVVGELGGGLGGGSSGDAQSPPGPDALPGAGSFVGAVLEAGGTRVARTWGPGEVLTGDRYRDPTPDPGSASSPPPNPAEQAEGGGLEGLDAVLVLEPAGVGPLGWEALGRFARRGGVVWVFPPGGATTAGVETPGQTDAASWFAMMGSAMGVPWTGDAGPLAEPGGGPWRVDVAGRVPGELSMLSADWASLWGPVRAWRWWPVSGVEPEGVWVRWAGGADEAGENQPADAVGEPTAEGAAGGEGSGVLLASTAVGAGRLVWLGVAVEPGWTNLGTKPVFPAMVHDVLRTAVGQAGRGLAGVVRHGSASRRIGPGGGPAGGAGSAGRNAGSAGAEVGDRLVLGSGWAGVTRLTGSAGPASATGAADPAGPGSGVSLGVMGLGGEGVGGPGGGAGAVGGLGLLEMGGVGLTEVVTRPGVYRRAGPVGGGEDAAGGGGVVVNVPAGAGDVGAWEAGRVAGWWDAVGPWELLDVADPGSALRREQRPAVDVGWWLLWVLLGLVLAEAALGRWFSHAVREKPESRRGAGRRVWVGLRRRGGMHQRNGGPPSGVDPPRGNSRGNRAGVGRAALWAAALLSGWGGGVAHAGEVGGTGGAGVTVLAAERGWWDRVLGLESVAWSEVTGWSWQHGLPGWGWALVLAGAGLVGWWGYRRLLGPRWVRVVLGGLRGLLVLLIAVLLAGPEVVRRDEVVEEDVLVVLVDRSASMGVADLTAADLRARDDSTTDSSVPGQVGQAPQTAESPSNAESGGEGGVGGEGGAVSRDAALRGVLAAEGEAVFGESGLGRGRQVLWLGLGDGAFGLGDGLPTNATDGDVAVEDATDAAGADGGRVPALGEAGRGATWLRTALVEAVSRAQGLGGGAARGVGAGGGQGGQGGRAISGVVLMSDGRSPESTGRSLVEGLRRAGVKVFTVPVGSAELPLDYALARVDAPAAGFVGDVVPVTVVIEKAGGEGNATNGTDEIDDGSEGPPAAARDLSEADAAGNAGNNDPTSEAENEAGDEGASEGGVEGGVVVRLVEAGSGRVLDQRRVGSAQLGRPVRLEGRSEATGALPWRVEVGGESDDDNEKADDNGNDRPTVGDTASGGSGGFRVGVAGELNLGNNVASVVVEMTDRPIRVLYIEGYPRWEYRYLKNMLIRESSIDSSVLLLSADRGFAQEGDTPITRLPAEAQEWRRYDVVVVGDVPAEVFSPEQRQQLRDLVSQRGVGVLWLGGAGSMPRGWGGTALADLLPMRDAEAVSRVPAASLSLRPTAVAEGLSVLRLDASSPGEAARGAIPDPADGVWAEGVWEVLPGLRWVQDLGALKGSAEVLAVGRGEGSADDEAVAVEDESSASGREIGGVGDGAWPVVVRLRFGAGESLYVATDETWRWRYGRGELYFERFWVQLVRMLGRGAAARGDEAVRLTVSSRRVPVGGSVVVELTVEDEAVLARELGSVRVEVRSVGPQPTDAADAESADKGTEDPAGGTGGPDAEDAETDASAAGGAGEAGGGVVLGVLELRPRAEDASAVGPAGGNGAGRVYSAVWQAPGIGPNGGLDVSGVSGGRVELVVIEPALADRSLQAELEVQGRNDELREVAADVPRLVRLAQDTGGRVIPLGDLRQLLEPGLVENLARRSANDVTEPVGRSGWVLGLLVGLLGLEWIGRKWVRLV